MFAVPAGLVLYRIPVRLFAHPTFAGGAVLAVLTLLYAIDNLTNAMFNPLCAAGLGALACLSRAPVTATAVPRKWRHWRRLPAASSAPPAVAPTASRWTNSGDGSIDEAFFSPDTLSLENTPRSSSQDGV
jgi:hypothetical protein